MHERILLDTMHGSHLYGLATPQSDMDFYMIYDYPFQYRPKRKAKQTIADDIDTTWVLVDRFIDLCFKGVPQALEALFAPEECRISIHEEWSDYQIYIESNIEYHLSDILDTYRRTSWNFYKQSEDKTIRHVFRLLFNAQDLRANCKMNPRLSSTQAGRLTELTSSFYRDSLYKDMLFETFN